MTDTATRTLTVTVPMDPPKALLPNQLTKQGSWHRRAEARQKCRAVAAQAAREATITGYPVSGPVHVTIHAAYGVDVESRAQRKPMRRLPDLDGTVAAVKPMIDGLADAGVIEDDDQVVKITATHERLPATKTSRPSGYTILTITELEN